MSQRRTHTHTHNTNICLSYEKQSQTHGIIKYLHDSCCPLYYGIRSGFYTFFEIRNFKLLKSNSNSSTIYIYIYI